MTWLAVSLYIVFALWLGGRARRKAADTGAAYWTAGRSLSATQVGLSISAGFMSVSWACVYAVQLFYGYGVGALWLITIPWLLELGGLYYLARRYRALPAFSQPEMVGTRFGPGLRKTVAVALTFVFLIWAAAEIYVAAQILAPGLGLSFGATVAGIGGVVAAYASAGGFRAVVATDKLQFGLVAGYIALMAGLAAYGLATADAPLWPAPGTVAGNGTPWYALFAPGLVLIVLTFVTYIPAGLFEADLWARVQAARDDQAARRGMLLAMGNAALFTGLLPLFIGGAALVLFPMTGGAAPAELGTHGDAILAALVDRYAPPAVAALAAVGLVAAAMSTIDTGVHIAALSLGYDLLGVHEGTGGTRRSQALTLLAVALSCGVAVFLTSLWDAFYFSGAILTTAVAFPLAAIFWKQACPSGVLWSSLFGLAATPVFYLLEAYGPLAQLQPAALAATGLGYVLWSLGAAVLGYLLGSLFQPKP